MDPVWNYLLHSSFCIPYSAHKARLFENTLAEKENIRVFHVSSPHYITASNINNDSFYFADKDPEALFIRVSNANDLCTDIKNNF